jgi:hypothetical protein
MTVRTNGLHPPAADDALWAALSTYTVTPLGAALGFTTRLARENGWTLAHAERIFTEYRRFLYLAVRADHPVTPSDAVDQVWHLHLTYSRDYWERLCPLLGAPLHHVPTQGGRKETARFYEDYSQTLRSYEQLFGTPAPADLWPSAQRRLFDDPRARRVHPRDGIVITWLRLVFALALAASTGAVIALLVKGA